jgi:hypothetical protein
MQKQRYIPPYYGAFKGAAALLQYASAAARVLTSTPSAALMPKQ